MASKGTTKTETQKRPLGRPTVPVRATVNPHSISFDPVKKVFRGVAHINTGPSRLEGRDAEIEIPAEIGQELMTADEQQNGNILIFAMGERGVQEFHAHAADCKNLVVYGKDKPRTITAGSRNEIITAIFNPQTFGYDAESDSEIEARGADVRFHSCLNALE
jgi:hypothetical protein